MGTWLLLAQIVTWSVDVSQLDMGVITRPRAIDTDGDPKTAEWLIGLMFSDRRRVLTERHGQICAGPWFSADNTWSLDTIDGRSVLTRLYWPTFEVMSLDTPACVLSSSGVPRPEL